MNTFIHKENALDSRGIFRATLIVRGIKMQERFQAFQDNINDPMRNGPDVDHEVGSGR